MVIAHEGRKLLNLIRYKKAAQKAAYGGSDRAPGMKSALAFQIRGMGLLGCREASEIDRLAVQPYLRFPVFPHLVPRCPDKLARGFILVWPPLILTIHGLRNIAQIRDAVVRPIAVDMVNVCRRPDTVDECPCQPMRWIVFSLKADHAVSILVNRTSARASNGSWRAEPGPRKFARLRVVMQSSL